MHGPNVTLNFCHELPRFKNNYKINKFHLIKIYIYLGTILAVIVACI
jgi:hypothetical protein